MKKKSNVVKNMKGTPKVIMVVVTLRFDIRAEIPITIKLLKIFDPKTFPIAIADLPFFVAIMVTESSGSDVPRATTVAAMTSVPKDSISESFIIETTVYLALK